MKNRKSIHLPLLAILAFAIPPNPGFGRVGRLPGYPGNTTPSHHEARHQPDNWVGKHRRHQRGDNIYNTSGSSQSVTIVFSSRRPRSFYYTIENDREISDSLTVRAPRRDRRYRLSYFNLTTPPINITAAITTGNYQIGDLAAGAHISCRARVKPLRRSVHRGTQRGVSILSISDHEKDRIKADFKRH